MLAQVLIDEERLRHRPRIGQPRRLDDDVVELVPPLHELAEDADEIAAHRAADAAVRSLEDFLFGPDDDLVVDADFAELVLDDGDALAVLLGQNSVQQRGFARAEKAREHGDRNPALIRHGAPAEGGNAGDRAPGEEILATQVDFGPRRSQPARE